MRVCVSCNRNSHKNSTAALQLQNVFAANLLRQFRYLSPLTHVCLYVCVFVCICIFTCHRRMQFQPHRSRVTIFPFISCAQVQVLGRISANSNYFSMTSSTGLYVSSLCGLSVNPRTLLSNQLLHMCASDKYQRQVFTQSPYGQSGRFGLFSFSCLLLFLFFIGFVQIADADSHADALETCRFFFTHWQISLAHMRTIVMNVYKCVRECICVFRWGMQLICLSSCISNDC